MELKEKLGLLEELLNIEEGTLNEDVELSMIEEWDSIAVISLIAMFDDEFDKTITTNEIKNFKTVRDITNKMD